MNAVKGPLKNEGDEPVEYFTVNTNKGAQLLEGKVCVYVTRKENELQIWGHIDSQSDILGNIDLDLSFGKVSIVHVDSLFADSCKCTNRKYCGCTESNFCGCTEEKSCECIKRNNAGTLGGREAPSFTCECITTGTGINYDSPFCI
ncbi:hypothetical protein M422DRAFT_53521 [Sphaerobolus stellatus SS14]|uniref:Uncharacterized protein n=1 Tax=Sphaerobolus stellatus (strain SS14) TaxID=990650 RepID=A0A0C9TM51_SPHS4|nr:hypothetical protein M422DRAFT_53521 [Sphaerobolus stellatus SS14]